ncbi:hypothetical protein T4B_9733 [Trichinella pseudospiralis]|uniref:Uncharacterized protein n=1 Tax=Trichinella pseudospiralis TaxID=6337 RepID=A0A0V0XHJ9_TRIPS|nr:hypothetical protein T4E_2701 [Trichinella pseudospiralis]KRZ16755.1 hypothetical protein T4B_9733 [Trichinella pseudospiralis]
MNFKAFSALRSRLTRLGFETALIPAIQGNFPNTRKANAVLGLITRYRTEEETKRKIKMLLVTAFLPVPQADTGDR